MRMERTSLVKKTTTLVEQSYDCYFQEKNKKRREKHLHDTGITVKQTTFFN